MRRIVQLAQFPLPIPYVEPEAAGPGRAPIETPEAIGLLGGLSLTILGVVLKNGVLIGVGSSLTAAGIFSAVVRKTREL